MAALQQLVYFRFCGGLRHNEHMPSLGDAKSAHTKSYSRGAAPGPSLISTIVLFKLRSTELGLCTPFVFDFGAINCELTYLQLYRL